MLRTLLGIDSGGTRTRAVRLEAVCQPHSGELTLRELGRGEVPSCNHYSVGWDAALSNLLGAASAALSATGHPAARHPAAGDRSGPALSWGLGLAGAVSPSECRDWEQRLRRALALPPQSTVRVAEDVLAAQSGAFASGPGAILIAGTGANAFGRTASGHTARADGLGPLLGDRGSGFWIGQPRCAPHLATTIASPPPALHAAALAALGVPNAPALVPLVYSPSWIKDQAAALVPQVQSAAAHGDELALDILRSAGTELAHTALAVLHQLQLQEIALCGGVLEHVPPVRLSFEAALSVALPGAHILAPRHDAAVGAALLALEIAQKSMFHVKQRSVCEIWGSSRGHWAALQANGWHWLLRAAKDVRDKYLATSTCGSGCPTGDKLFWRQ